jgi:hypothetical protein
VYPRLAAAQAAGEVDGDAARAIRRCLDTLPGELALRRGRHAEAEIEAVLVEAASRVDTRGLAAVIDRLRAYVDPDEAAAREEEIRARRSLDLTTRADGTARLAGELTREATAALAAVLDPLSAPTPAENGTTDPRAPGATPPRRAARRLHPPARHRRPARRRRRPHHHPAVHRRHHRRSRRTGLRRRSGGRTRIGRCGRGRDRPRAGGRRT